ncbi:MAG: 50S ribosomal protein L6 [Proteobacteria bacterium]|nr:50S ribosomal protein L6 [Pseudomonadota bacterium]
MSRIGIQPINIPDGVKVTLDGNVVSVTGSKGSLKQELRDEISVKIDGSVITVSRNNDERESVAFHGLMRSLVANMVTGVTEGFEKKLEIIGVGYRAEVKGSDINLLLGYSHPIKYSLPDGISASVDKQTLISIMGADKQLVGQVAADVRAFRKPEPYKGKGIRYVDEQVRRKAGKAGKAGA